MPTEPAPPEAARSGPTYGNRRAVFSWCLYDWASSGFPAVVLTFVFAAWFTRAVAPDIETGTSQWGTALGLSALFVAILSPPFGAIADQTGRRKPWLLAFTLLAVIGSAVLWYAEPGADNAVFFVLATIVVANVGFEVAGVFYNAMLPDLVPPARMGRISGWAWGLGYAGGLCVLGISLLWLVLPETPPLGLEKASGEHIRATALLVAAWFALFMLPLFLFTPDRKSSGLPAGEAVRRGMATLTRSLSHVRAYPETAKFLLARLFYIDGLNTLFALGGVYAAGTFDMTVEEILTFGIALNITAGLGAFAFGWIDDRMGSKQTILIALVCLMALAVPLLIVESKTMFWALAAPLGLFMGPIQAASRTMMARLAPPELMTEAFGLFALSGKVTAFAGPLLVAWVTALAHSQRAGMATILILLVTGTVLLLRVKAPPQ